MRVLLPLALVCALGLSAAACAPLRSHQGYVIDPDLVNAIQPGVDNRQSVLSTLGTPSFRSQFAGAGVGAGDMYYISRDARNYAFNSPRVRDQVTIRISFDPAGNVTAVRRSDETQVASISPDGRVTPTLGRKRGFFQDLFGNIGAVGAPGAGAAAGGNRDRP